MLKRNTDKIKTQVGNIVEKLKPIEQNIVELDEAFYSVKNWIEEDAKLNEFLDIISLYGSYSEILGLNIARKRIIKSEMLNENEITEMLTNESNFQRSTPTDINFEISNYLTKRIGLKDKQLEKNNKKKKNSLFKTIKKSLNIKQSKTV